MTKKEFVAALAAKTGMTKADAEKFLDAQTEVINETLVAGGEVTIPEVVKFHVADVAARNGRNPKTGETIEIAAHKAPKAKLLKAVKRLVKGE